MDADELRETLAERLRTAMRSRDRVATAALRSVSAALANAEAIEVAPPEPTTGSEHVAGAVGVGAAEAERKSLDPTEVAEIVTEEAEQREAAARTYAEAGQTGRAETLRAEAAVVRSLLD